MILTGAPGAGKTSVLDALCTMLEIECVGFGAIESEMCSRGCPWLSLGEWVPQLAAVIALQKQAGRRLFLVAATTETGDELEKLIDALALPRVLVICLRAPPMSSPPALPRASRTRGRARRTSSRRRCASRR